MQECNLMEAQAQKLNLLFSSYAAESKVESAQLDEGLMGALTGGAIGTGVGALVGNVVGNSVADDASTKIATGVDQGVEAGKAEIEKQVNSVAADAIKLPLIGSTVQDARDRLTSGAQKGLSLAGDKLKNAVSKATSSSIVDTATKLGAGAGGIAGVGVGYAVTSKNDDKKKQQQAVNKDGSIIAAESMKVYEMFRAAIDEEEQASNAKKAGYSATGAFLGTAIGGPVGAAIGGATGAAMTNTDGEQKSQQIGKITGAGIGGAAGAALTGGSLAGTTIGAAAGAMLGDTIGKMTGNKHSKPTPVKNSKKPSKPKP